jgi:hypothetical protein
VAALCGFRRCLFSSSCMPGVESLAGAFHEHVTPFRVTVVCFTIMIILLGITLPVIAVTKQNAKQNHIDAAQTIANSMSVYIDSQFDQIYAAVDLLHGFAASAAPLQAPDYARDSVAERVNITTTPGTAGALSLMGFNNVLSGVTDSFRGFRNALVQPGIVNIYAPNGSTSANRDWLNNTQLIRDEYFYMVNTTDDSIYGPLPSGTAGTSAWDMVTAVRRIVWTNLSCPTTNRYDFDPVTGWHVNWDCVWGAITVAMGLVQMSRESNFITYVGTDFEYLFESYPRPTVTGQITPYAVLDSSQLDTSAFLTDAMNCANTPGFENLCFRVMPASGNWNGHDMGSDLMVAALLEVFIPLTLVLVVVIFARLVVGPPPNPLQFAPMKAPFHVVVIDLVGASDMWNDSPFVMHEVMTLFNAQLNKLTKHHRVHVAVRLGNTVIIASAHRQRIVAFAQDMVTWAHTYKWPPAIAVHCPSGTVQFTFTMHSCYNASIRLELDSGYYEIVGSDVQVALALRVAAIPGQLICTHSFLGISGEPSAVDGAAQNAASTTYSSEMGTTDVNQLAKHVHELGMCEVPVPCDGMPVTRITGFLVPSAGTGDRRLNDVVDNFDDQVWAEWRNARAYENNPLGPNDNASVDMESEIGFGRHSYSNSRTASIVPTLTLQHLQTVHINNEEADTNLPGSAVDLNEAREIALVLSQTVGINANSRRASELIPGVGRESSGQSVRQLREITSLATYFYVAFRFVFVPLDEESQKLIVSKSGGAQMNGNVLSDNALHGMAARCARYSRQYLDAIDSPFDSWN